MSWSKLLERLGSPWLTIGTMAVLVALLLALVSFPQAGADQPPAALGASAWAAVVGALGLNQVTRSPWFAAVVALLYVNLTALLYRRFFRSRALDRATLGLVVMHGSVYCFLFGALATWQGRFDGTLLLTEGQSFVNEPRAAGYNRYLDAGSGQYGWRATLLALEEARDFRGTLTDLQARLRVAEPGGGERIAKSRVNHPAEVAGLSLYLRKYGIAPKLTIAAAAGSPAFDAFVTLDLAGGRVDEIPLETMGVRLRASRRHPAETGVWLAGRRADGSYPEPTYLEPGGRLALPGGRTLAVGEIRRWAAFSVSRDPGFTPIVVGSILLVAGMALRFFPGRAWFGNFGSPGVRPLSGPG